MLAVGVLLERLYVIIAPAAVAALAALERLTP